MGLVVNTLAPVPAARIVTARLIASIGWYTLPDGSIREAAGVWTAEVADDGSWQLDLPPSGSYDAEDTWYQIDEPGARHAAVVPAGPGPFQLHNIAIIDPAAPACCPPPPAGSVADGARTLEELLDVEGTTTAVPGDTLIRSADGPWRPGRPPGGYRHEQSAPVQLVQILHGLPYAPAGITSLDPLGTSTEHDRVEHPMPGVTEITYGAPFAGVVYLS